MGDSPSSFLAACLPPCSMAAIEVDDGVNDGPDASERVGYIATQGFRDMTGTKVQRKVSALKGRPAQVWRRCGQSRRRCGIGKHNGMHTRVRTHTRTHTHTKPGSRAPVCEIRLATGVQTRQSTPPIQNGCRGETTRRTNDPSCPRRVVWVVFSTQSAVIPPSGAGFRRKRYAVRWLRPWYDMNGSRSLL
jgi:hypothetical protein